MRFVNQNIAYKNLSKNIAQQYTISYSSDRTKNLEITDNAAIKIS